MTRREPRSPAQEASLENGSTASSSTASSIVAAVADTAIISRLSGGRSSRRRGRSRQLHRIAGSQCLGRAVDHPILRREAGSYLDAVTEIPAKLNGLEHHFVASPKNCDLRAAVDRH